MVQNFDTMMLIRMYFAGQRVMRAEMQAFQNTFTLFYLRDVTQVDTVDGYFIHRFCDGSPTRCVVSGT